MTNARRLIFDLQASLITVVSTLAILADHYFTLTPWRNIDHLIWFLAVPVVIITAVFRQPLAEFGLQLGDWRTGIKISAISMLVSAPVIWLAVRGSPDLRNYYQPSFSPDLALLTFLELLGWEFTFRGFLLFGYEKSFGSNALWLQAAPFALAHITKPALETMTTIFGGFFFGWAAWRTRSFLYPLLIHWFILTCTILVSSGRLG